MTAPTRLLNVGRKLHARVRDFFDATPDATAPPLELFHAALDQLERKVQPTGRGARLFPYNRVSIHIAQPNADRPAIEALFAQLPTRLRERLTELRCALPKDFQSELAFDEPAQPAGPAGPGEHAEPVRAVLRVECRSTEDKTSVAAVAPDRERRLQLRLAVATGQCEQPEYTFPEGSVIAIGRGAQPADTAGRVRRNHIAFLEVRDGASETVARAHARLEFDVALHAYVLFNESSSNPTFIRRDGRNLRVAPRDPRGVRVQSGDELQLGRAVLRIAISNWDEEEKDRRNDVRLTDRGNNEHTEH